VPPAEGEDASRWSAAHTQWPGGREPGEPVYDQWLANSGPMLADWDEMHALERVRLAELLDLVGPAVLVTHSASGPGAFLAADARTGQVAALIAIEIVPHDATRGLSNLSRFPIAVVSGEASMFRATDGELVASLGQAGCDVEHIQLGEHGVHGNAHGVTIERNNAEVLAVLTSWVASRTG
jgi:hypothetical protein